jgi:hypothetical protein
VGTMAVVVLDIEVQDANKLPTPCDQEMVQTLLARGANPALGHGVSVRSPDRVRMTSAPTARQTSSKAR